MMEFVLRREIVVNKTVCRIMAVGVFVLLTSLGAYVRIPLPFTPVPVTLQTFFVLLAGAFLGARLGVLSQSIYISLGILGMPVFAGAGSGLFYFLGPTGGYLVGFILASFFVGASIKRYGNNFLSVLGFLCLGDIILLCCGVFWLSTFLGLDLRRAFLIGFVPFIFVDSVKVSVASFLYWKLRTRLGEIF